MRTMVPEGIMVTLLAREDSALVVPVNVTGATVVVEATEVEEVGSEVVLLLILPVEGKLLLLWVKEVDGSKRGGDGSDPVPVLYALG